MSAAMWQDVPTGVDVGGVERAYRELVKADEYGQQALPMASAQSS